MVLTVLASIGGIESALIPLGRALQADGHEVIVYVIETPSMPNQNVTALKQAQIEMVTAPVWLVRLVRLGIMRRLNILSGLTWLMVPLLIPVAFVDAMRRRRSWGRSWQGAKGRWQGFLARRLNFEWLYYLPLERRIQHQPPTVVHVHGWGCGEDPPQALEWLKSQGFPSVYTEHNSPDPTLHDRVFDAPMNLAEVIVAVSRTAEQGLRQLGQAMRPIQVIPYSVEQLPLSSIQADPTRFTLTCLARLMPQKGHRFLLEAMAEVVMSRPNACLILAGDGPLRNELAEQVSRLGLQSVVEFRGIVSRSQLPELLAQTDLVVLPSLWEGLPVALIEALSAGKAVVASNVGGNPELVVDGENGLIVPPRDSRALAQAILTLATDDVRRRTMARASRHRFETGGFSPTEVATKTLAAYQLAVNLAAARS